MNIVNIDFIDFIKNVLPVKFQTNKFKKWLYSLVKPLRDIHDLFYSFYETKLFFLKHTAQTVDIEHYLNSLYNIDHISASGTPAHPFSVGNFDIYITNNDVMPDYLYNISENIDSEDEVYLYNDSEYPLGANSQEMYLYNLSDVSLGDNFTVNIPTDIYKSKPWKFINTITTDSQVASVIGGAVNKFKFANMSFNTNIY